MLTQAQLGFIGDIYTAVGVPMLLFDTAGDRTAFPEQFADAFSEEFLRYIPADIAAGSHPDGVLLISWDNLYHSAAVRLGGDVFLTTAPVSMSAHAQASLLSAASGRVKPARFIDFCRFVAEAPPMGEYQLAKLTGAVRQFVCGAPAEGIAIKEAASAQQAGVPESKAWPPAAGRHASNYEADIVAAVEAGDVSRLKKAYNRPLNGYIGRMSLNDLRQAKYCFVCFMFMASRAAVRGGLPLETAMQLSDRYCQRMDGMTSAAEVTTLAYSALEDFCIRTSRCNGGGKGHIARICCEYVSVHLYERITMEDVAAYCGLSQRSIARNFKKDMGVSLFEYIGARRLEEARYLLSATDLSVGQISHLLCYAGQSHFSKLFREAAGMSPTEYRRENYRT